MPGAPLSRAPRRRRMSTCTMIERAPDPGGRRVHDERVSERRGPPGRPRVARGRARAPRSTAPRTSAATRGRTAVSYACRMPSGRLDDGDRWGAVPPERRQRRPESPSAGRGRRARPREGAQVGLPSASDPTPFGPHGDEASGPGPAEHTSRDGAGRLLLGVGDRVLEIGDDPVRACGERLLQPLLLVAGREQEGAGRCERHEV